jgi:hypothetical protein
MSDEKNDDQTAKLDELFGTAPANAAQDGDETPRTGATDASTTPLPEAEPTWLRAGSGPGAERTAPRIRWAGIVWGLIFAATGWFAVWTLAAGERRTAFADWVLTLDGNGWAVVGALAIGAVLVVVGLTQALKAATRGPRP